MASKPLKGTLYLLPMPLGEAGDAAIPAQATAAMHRLRHFIVERGKTVRAYMRTTQPPIPFSEMHFYELNKHTTLVEQEAFLLPAERGEDIGLLSEAGCPGIADPGAYIVGLAHQKGISVRPMTGPSSIFLALMASGMNGQQFCFHGYLSPKKVELANDLRRLEQQSIKFRQTQIFIETPYRNESLIETALQSLHPSTRFCIAANLTTPEEYILTLSIGDWRRSSRPDLNKQPALFLLEGH